MEIGAQERTKTKITTSKVNVTFISSFHGLRFLTPLSLVLVKGVVEILSVVVDAGSPAIR